jgi:WS/DGAT/MGAT family acyltransferase
MKYWHYERLSAMDAGMFRAEDANTHMHVGAVALFEAAPLKKPDGGLDIDRARTALEVALHTTPRFRQRLATIPILDHPVWIDDMHFNLQYHVRHTALPRPGNIRQLKRLVGRLMSQKLDPGRPLWEAWIVENVEEDRFALVVKAHHCMIDGIAGIDLLKGMMRLEPSAEPGTPHRWIPRAAPPGSRLLADELARRASLPLSLAGVGWRALTSPRESLASLRESLATVRESTAGAGGQASPTPLDDSVGPFRRVDWLHLDIEPGLAVKKALGGTLNDVVLSCAAGAFGRFLQQRGIRIEELDFRAAVPVNIRTKDEAARLGNRISTLFVQLPVAESDPRRRHEQVIATTQELKRSAQTGGWGVLEELSDRAFPSLMGHMIRLMSNRMRLVNAYVSNIPGPRVPVYFLGCRMLEIYPVAPVVNVLAVALFSYHKGLYWGFNADWDRFPDLHDLVEATRQELERLHKAAAPISVSESGEPRDAAPTE